MTLYLVQHGDALSKAENPERPLSEKGRGDVARMAAFLSEGGIRVTRVIHSGKTRAHETAQLLSQEIGPGDVAKCDIGLAPNDPTGPLKTLIESWDDDVLVVGHLPFMGRMVADLAGAVAFEPATVVALEKNEDGNWTLQWMLRPSLFGA